jgi:hypothetical protein
MRTTEELIESVVNSSKIPSSVRRREIERELRSHIEDFVMAARESGRDQGEIEDLVRAHFGDPRDIANGFAWVYRHERRRLRAIAFALSTLFLAVSLFVAILATQAGLAMVSGTPMIKVLASRHTAIEGLDILVSVVAYLGFISLETFFKSRQFQKAASLLILIDAVLMVLASAAGLRANVLLFGLVNALFLRALQSFVTAKVARVSIVVVCFPLAGLVLMLQRMPVSQARVVATCASWLAMGIGYQLMTDYAGRADAALSNGLSRFQAAFSKGEIR